MARHLSRLWTLLPVGLIAAHLLPCVVHGGQDDEPEMSVAFVTDAPVTAQGPAEGRNQLRDAQQPRPAAENGSKLVVVDNAPSRQDSRSGSSLFGGLFGGDRQANRRPVQEEERKFGLPSLRFLGGAKSDAAADQPPRSSIAMVGPPRAQSTPAATARNSRRVDPNVAQASHFREAPRSVAPSLRQRSGNNGSLIGTLSNDGQPSSQSQYRSPSSNDNLSTPRRAPQGARRQTHTASRSNNRSQSTGLLNEFGQAIAPGQKRAQSMQRRQALADNTPVPMRRTTSSGQASSRQQRTGGQPVGEAQLARSTPRPSPPTNRRPKTVELPSSDSLAADDRQSTAEPLTKSDSDPQQRGPLTPAERHVRDLIVQVHEQSQSAESLDDYTLVVESCRRALAVQPEGDYADYAKQLCAWGLNRRGQLKADEGRTVSAMLDFEDAVRHDSEQWRAVHNRGVLHAQDGNFELAFDDFNTCTELNPRFAKAYSNRAALFVQAGDLLAALQDYRRAIALDPDLAVAHKGRGRVCHMLGSAEEALRHFDAAAQLSPDDAHVVASRADLLADMGRYHEAAAEYQRAIMLNDQMAHAFRSSAWLLATCPEDDIRDVEQALTYAEKAVELDNSENPVSLDTLAAAQANAGQFDTAVQTIARAIEMAPQEERDAYEARLRLYERSQPFRVRPVKEIATVSFDEQD